MENKATLDSISVGELRCVSDVFEDGSVRRRLFDLGFSVGERVRCVGTGSLGDPVMLTVGGRVVAVRRRDLKRIYTELI